MAWWDYTDVGPVVAVPQTAAEWAEFFDGPEFASMSEWQKELYREEYKRLWQPKRAHIVPPKVMSLRDEFVDRWSTALGTEPGHIEEVLDMPMSVLRSAGQAGRSLLEGFGVSPILLLAVGAVVLVGIFRRGSGGAKFRKRIPWAALLAGGLGGILLLREMQRRR